MYVYRLSIWPIPFPRHHRRLIIADIELLDIIIAALIWGVQESGDAQSVVPDSTNAMPMGIKGRKSSTRDCA